MSAEIPELAIVRARSDAGPYRRDDLLSLAFTTPLRGRLVTHEARDARDARVDCDAQSARFPEAFEVEVVRAAEPYACGSILALSFVDPRFVTIRPAAGRTGAAEPAIAVTMPTPGAGDSSIARSERRDGPNRRSDDATVEAALGTAAPAPRGDRSADASSARREASERSERGLAASAPASAMSASASAPGPQAATRDVRAAADDAAAFSPVVTSEIAPRESHSSAAAAAPAEADARSTVSLAGQAMRATVEPRARSSETLPGAAPPESSLDARSTAGETPHPSRAMPTGASARPSVASAVRSLGDGVFRPGVATSRPAIAFVSHVADRSDAIGDTRHLGAARAPTSSEAPSVVTAEGVVRAHGVLEPRVAAVAAPATASIASEQISVSAAFTLRSVWSVERTARFVQLVDKLFTVDRLGWYRHALVVRMLLPETVTCADANGEQIAQRELDALRAASTVVLGRPLLAAFMPNFAVSAQWLTSLESPAEARATGALRDAIVRCGSADVESPSCDVERLAVVRLDRRSLERSSTASIEALLPMLVPHLTTSDTVSTTLGAYRSAMIELFGQMADVSEAVRLRTMTQPSHLLDDRLWQAVGALGASYSAAAAS